MMDNGSLPPYAVTKEAYKLLCKPLCADDLKALHELLKKQSVKEYFANSFGAESEKDVRDWTKKVWAPYVEFLTGMNEKGEDIPEKPGVFFSSCSSWVANFDPETRPEKLWERFLEEDLPLRRNIVMLYLNWGGDLSRKRSADDKGGWTGLYGFEKESKSQRSVAWRNFHHTKKEMTEWRAQHSRFSAMAAGPIAGAYWTDFYKFIPTPNKSSLDNFLKFAKNEKIYDELEKLMLTLFEHELERLDFKPELERLDGNAHPTPSQESHDFNRLILATTDSYDILRSHDLSKYGFKPIIKPWCLIRWPHHSGSNPGTFKATTLAYAYGRVERALEYVEGKSHKWSWPFGAYVGSESAVEFRGPSHPKLLEWFKNEFAGDCHKGAVDFTKCGVLHCYKRYSALVEKKNAEGKALLKSKDAIVADAKKALAEYRADDAIDAVKSVMYKDGSEPSAEDYDPFRVEVESSQAFPRLEPSEGQNGEPGKSLEQRQVEFVVDALYWKDLVAEDDVDAAFLLGWRSEDKLVPFFKDGEWRVPDAFDKTLMPAPKDLVSVKEELAKMRKKQG